MQELYKILQEELQKKFGDKEKVDSLLEKLGEIVIMDLVAEIMDGLEAKDKAMFNKLSSLLNAGEMQSFIQQAKNFGFPVEKIFDTISQKAIEEVFANVE